MSEPVFRLWATMHGQAEFQVTNWIDGSLTRPRIVDRLDPRVLELTVPRHVPIRQFGTIRISKKGKPYFRGYVADPPQIKNEKKTLRVLGMENLLLNAPGAPAYYKKGTPFSVLFSDTLTEQDPREPPGLIAVANSNGLAGLEYVVHHAGDNIIKIAGAGPASRLGNCALYACGYDGVRQLSEQFALANLTAIDDSYYRDTTNNDLYVRIDAANDRAWPDLGGLLFDNAFDTGIRLGELQDPTMELKGNLQTTLQTNMGDTAVGIARRHGLYVSFSETRSNTLISILEEEEDIIDELDEEKDGHITEIYCDPAPDPKVHSLTGIGRGSQIYSKADLDWHGVFVRGLTEFADGFKDADGYLTTFTDAKYAVLQNDAVWKVTTPRHSVVAPGQYIRLKPRHELPVNLVISSVEEDLLGKEMVLELGNSSPGPQDSWDSVLETSIDGYTEELVTEKHAAVSPAAVTIRVAAPCHVGEQADLSFAVPKGAKDAALNPRIILELTIQVNRPAGDTSESQTDLGPCVYLVQAGATAGAATPVKFGYFVGIQPGCSIPAIDVTDHMTADTTNHVLVDVKMANNVTDDSAADPHTTTAEHPLVSISATMRFLERAEVIE